MLMTTRQWSEYSKDGFAVKSKLFIPQGVDGLARLVESVTKGE